MQPGVRIAEIYSLDKRKKSSISTDQTNWLKLFALVAGSGQLKPCWHFNSSSENEKRHDIMRNVC